MPSAHAQFMGFYLAFSTLQLLMRVNTNPAYKVCAIIFNLALSAAVCYGRVQLGVFTRKQQRMTGDAAQAILHVIPFPPLF